MYVSLKAITIQGLTNTKGRRGSRINRKPKCNMFNSRDTEQSYTEMCF